MQELSGVGRALLVLGLVLAGVGALLIFSDRIPLLGRLPGDISLRGERWSLYAPLGTTILVSVVLTLLLTLWSTLGRR